MLLVKGVSPIFPPDVAVAAAGPELRQNDAFKDEPRGGSKWARLVFRDDPKSSNMPLRCPKVPRDTISTYTDGGVKNPANKWLATAGFGVWTPAAETDEPASEDEMELTLCAKEGGGLKQWASLSGQRCSLFSFRVRTSGFA